MRNFNHLVKLYKSNTNDIFNNSINYTLKEISILCLLTCFDFSINDDKIILHRTNNHLDELLIDLIINQNPKIEKSIIKNVSLFNDSLLNYYREPDVLQETIENDKSTLLTLLFQIRKIQERLRIKRKKCSYRINIFNSFELKRIIGRNLKIPVSLIYHNPFTDTYNNFQREGKLQYEKRNEKIFNVIIPDKRFDTLYSKLKQGKILGYKFSFYYHNKGLLIWDILISIVLGLGHVYLFTLDIKEFSFTLGFIELCKKILWIPSGFFLAKCYYDSKYWIKGFDPFFFTFNK